MKFFFSIIFIISSAAFGNECSEEYKFKFDNGEKTLCLLKEKKVLVSENCKKLDCDAVKIAFSKKIKTIKIDVSELEGGKNPSTLLCKKLEGKLFLGISEISHQQYFCQFKDNSLISTSSLYAKFQE